MRSSQKVVVAEERRRARAAPPSSSLRLGAGEGLGRPGGSATPTAPSSPIAASASGHARATGRSPRARAAARPGRARRARRRGRSASGATGGGGSARAGRESAGPPARRRGPALRALAASGRLVRSCAAPAELGVEGVLRRWRFGARLAPSARTFGSAAPACASGASLAAPAAHSRRLHRRAGRQPLEPRPRLDLGRC